MMVDIYFLRVVCSVRVGDVSVSGLGPTAMSTNMAPITCGKNAPHFK